MHRGNINLWVKLLDSAMFMDSDLLKVWIWCLLKARREPGTAKIKLGEKLYEKQLQAGQFLFGRQKAAEELHMKPSSVRNRIQKLKNLKNLDIQPDSHFSIITIKNYIIYQPQLQGDRTAKRTSLGQVEDTLYQDTKIPKSFKKHTRVREKQEYVTAPKEPTEAKPLTPQMEKKFQKLRKEFRKIGKEKHK